MDFIIEKMANEEWRNTRAWKYYTDELPPGRYIVKIESTKKRSNAQNDYLHGVLIPQFKLALNSVGYDEVKTNDQAKEIIKRMFLTEKVVSKETGEVLEYTKHTSELKTGEMKLLIDEVIKFAAENMNYEIPFPNEQLTINQYE